MNPGAVNLWVREGMERFGRPRSITHFEYDTAQSVEGWLPLITWSRETLLDEIINDAAGYMEGKDRVKLQYPNPLKNRMDMTGVLRPIMDLPAYPRGFLLLHEENITIAQEYDLPSRFFFAMDSKTMDYLESLYDRDGFVPVDALELGDNQNILLRGSVTIGVVMEYSDRSLYLYNRTGHERVAGSSGSCWQVAAGLYSALFTLITDPLAGHVYFPEDLYGTSFARRISENLPVQQRVVDGRVKDPFHPS
jgi:hypothetical protein